MNSQPYLDGHINTHPGVAVLRTGIYVVAGAVAVCDGIRAGAASVTRRVRTFVKRIRSFHEVDEVADPPYPFLPYGGSVRPFKDRSPRDESRRAASS